VLAEFLHEPRIAYFTMEVALRDEVPTYAGGLGILAGDTVRSAADLDVPLVAVSLVSRAGYFRQEIDARGRQIERDDSWDPGQLARPSQAKIALHIEGREVWVRSWLYVVEGLRGHRIPVLLLDTDLEENREDDRRITHHLYGDDEANRLKQEMVLGIGGVRMLHALGFEIRQYHLNEGHSALLALELLRWFVRSPQEVGSGFAYDIPRVRQLCNFTTHTPVEAGHDQFPYDLVERVMGDLVDLAELKALAGDQRLNMTRLALNLSEYVNGVSARHAEVSQNSFPGFRIHAVVNGVHAGTWTSPDFVRLYDKRLPAWRHEPELLSRIVDQIPDEALWDAHVSAKRTLIERVKALTGIELKLEVPILAFARRMTAYKRPDLLFSDLERLKRIAHGSPFQVVMAGKAHPHDGSGKQLIETLTRHCRELADVIPIAFLPNYGMRLALELVAGADVWLNTPLRPFEASGTSGMKAAFNGVPSLSILDGWWIEGCMEGVTGWAIGNDSSSAEDGDAGSLYDKLETTILPLYRSGVHAWAPVMRGAIGKNAAYFNSHRMMRRYAIEAYIR
jgi:glycogen phosphorylase